MGRLLVLTDVTQLTRLIQVKADFAANASHELRTPLSAIRAAIETLLQMNLQDEADAARHFVAMIERHSRRLEALVADLLELSRLESSRLQFQPADVDLRQMLSDIREQHAERLAQKDLHWSEDLPGNLSQVQANPHLLRIVLENLVDNSIKFTNPGGHLSITCRQASQPPTGSATAITVADDGCGIDVEEQSRVFERFYQVERARSGGALRGTGLGLSIVRHAMAAMKGTVELQSQPGRGTSITITIPQAARPDAAPGPQSITVTST
jgi:two-component system phosphate regulon sensor histidine kinase PhoR